MVFRLDSEIDEKLKEYISDNEDIELVGLSYDRDGISYGHDYFESNLKYINNLHHSVHIFDTVEDEYAIVTLNLNADIEMDCYYEDLDNACYDYETDDYIFVDIIHVVEKHHVHNACRIKIYTTDESIEVIPFRLRLGGDSLKERINIDDSEDCT